VTFLEIQSEFSLDTYNCCSLCIKNTFHLRFLLL